MNKYLEKVALSNPAFFAATGGIIEGLKGWHAKSGTKEEYSKKRRIINAISRGMGGALIGAYLGKLLSRPPSGYKHYSRTSDPGNLKQHFKDMGAAGFRTKAEAHKHYKVMASKWHPDKPGGSHEKMQKLNEAWTKAKAHPDFEKLAQENRYIKYLDSSTFKKKVLTDPDQPTPKALEKEREPGVGPGRQYYATGGGPS